VHDPGAYDRAVGSDYDLLYPDALVETAAAVAMLAELAGDDSAQPSFLEFGVGTGRLVLPLLERGVRVAGIEHSTNMLDQLRAKERGDEVEVVVGDFATARVDGHFAAVAVVFNTIFALPSREAQRACFRNAALHLASEGCFVVEAHVLQAEQASGEWSLLPRTVAREHVELQFARYDPASHRLERTLVHLLPQGNRFITVNDTYASPSELDLMAEAAGLRLRSRSADWDGGPFVGTSHRHVSVYERANSA